MPTVSEVKTNLPRVTQTWDEEWGAKQSYDNPPEADVTVKPVDLEEALGSREEMNYAASAPRRWKNQHLFMGKENERRRLVNILSPESVFRKLRKAGIDARSEAPSFNVWVIDDETGKPVMLKRERTVGRLWLHDNAVQGRVGVSAWVWNEELKRRERKMVTTLQYPYGPEWSLLHFDEHFVPITEKYRGWRTAMLHLILADVLTEDEVNRAFGPVPLDSVSLLYREQVQTHRRRRAGLIE